MMENSIIQDFEKLEEYAKNKSFNKLTPQEKEWVLNFQSEEEYNALTDFYKRVSVEQGYKEIEPNKSTKTKLDSFFGSNKKRNNPVYLRKIPFYQSATAAVLCLVAGFWIHFSVGKMSQSHKTAGELVRDTIQVIQYIQSSSVYFPLTVTQNHILSQVGLEVLNKERDLLVDTLFHVTKNVFVTDKNQREGVRKLFQKSNPNNEKNLYADTLLKKMLIVLY